MDNSDERDYEEEAANRRLMVEEDEWDGSSRNQSNDFFVVKSGYVTILWHVTNNPYEKYDPSKSYHAPALDGSALYVWCDPYLTEKDALRHIDRYIQQLDGFDTIDSVHML